MTPDKLDAIFARQARFQKMLGNHFEEWNPEQQITFIKDMVLAATDELHEALQETDWKPWVHVVRGTRREAYTKELIDAFHFLLNLMLVVGMEPNELVMKYHEKMDVNIQRQQEKYDGRNKCPQCKRALDDYPIPPVSLYERNFCSLACAGLWSREQRNKE